MCGYEGISDIMVIEGYRFGVHLHDAVDHSDLLGLCYLDDSRHTLALALHKLHVWDVIDAGSSSACNDSLRGCNLIDVTAGFGWFTLLLQLRLLLLLLLLQWVDCVGGEREVGELLLLLLLIIQVCVLRLILHGRDDTFVVDTLYYNGLLLDNGQLELTLTVCRLLLRVMTLICPMTTLVVVAATLLLLLVLREQLKLASNRPNSRHRLVVEHTLEWETALVNMRLHFLYGLCLLRWRIAAHSLYITVGFEGCFRDDFGGYLLRRPAYSVGVRSHRLQNHVNRGVQLLRAAPKPSYWLFERNAWDWGR